MDVREKIEAGAYQPNMNYPARPTAPAVLRKMALKLTTAEAESLPTIRQEHEADMEAYRNDLAEYQQRGAEGLRQFQADLEEENGLIGHPKAEVLWAKAWEQGHSCGLLEVVGCYEDLLELVQ